MNEAAPMNESAEKSVKSIAEEYVNNINRLLPEQSKDQFFMNLRLDIGEFKEYPPGITDENVEEFVREVEDLVDPQ